MSQEPTGCQVAYRLRREHALIESEIEVLEGTAVAQVCRFQPLGQVVGFPVGDFILYEQLKELQIAEIAFGGFPDAKIEVLDHPRHP